MALTPMVSTRCDKGQEQTVAQVRQFYEQFLLYVREGLQSLGLPLARATLAQPHDAVFAWTATTLFVVASPGSATHVTSTHTYRDFTAVAGI
ncbi:MAG: hypothetical protein GTN78_16155, partial [Gemmatimonadales bacterium]|nr:hypothetical protein [Gemmatimonadales bacterium]